MLLLKLVAVFLVEADIAEHSAVQELLSESSGLL